MIKNLTIGQRVKYPTYSHWGAGKIIDVKARSCLVEFDNEMGGHSGGGDITGKAGHCWWVAKGLLVVEEPLVLDSPPESEYYTSPSGFRTSDKNWELGHWLI